MKNKYSNTSFAIIGLALASLVSVPAPYVLVQSAFADETQSKTGASLTDPQIAAILSTANKADIEAGKLGEHKSENDAVKSFAKRMVAEHSAVSKQTDDLLKKLNITPKESPTSKVMQFSGDNTVSSLKSLKGEDFDAAYVTHEVAFHKTVLDAIDKALLPNAKNPQIKAHIEKIRPAIQAHLDHAVALQKDLEKMAS